MKKDVSTTEEEKQKIESAVQAFANLMVLMLEEKEASEKDTNSIEN